MPYIRTRRALRLILIYAVVIIAYLLLSNWVVKHIGADTNWSVGVLIIQGVLFVLVSIISLYLILHAAPVNHSDGDDRHTCDPVRYFDQLGQAVMMTDQNFTVQYWNKAAEALYGWSRAEAVGQSLHDLVRPLSLNGDQLAVVHVSAEREYWQGEAVQQGKDGRTVDVCMSVALRKDDTGQSDGIIVVSSDMTKHKQTEEILRKERDLATAILDTSGLLVMVLDPAGRIVRFNRACEQLSGYTFAEVQHKHFWDVLLSPQEATLARSIFTHLEEGRLPNECENHWLTRDGDRRTIAWSNTSLRKATGEIEYIVSTGIDMTIRNQWERELKQRNRELVTLNTVTAAVSSSLEITEVFGILNTLLAEQLNVAGGALYYYNDAEDLLSLEASWGLPPRMSEAFRTLPAYSAHNERVVRRRDVILKEDFREVDLFLAVGLDLDRPRWRSYLGIPLLARGQIQGVVDLFSHAPTVFEEDQIDFFKVLGQQVGVAIQNARLFKQVRTGHERLQTLSRRLLDAQEAERRNIARELHDEIGQALTAMKINLQSVRQLADVPALMPYLEENIGIVDRTLQQVRDLSLDLRPSMLDDLGLVAALRWYVDRQSRLAGFDARFTADLSTIRLPPDLETACFRVTQEALTNVVRHAQAHRVRVSLQYRDDMLYLIIRDDGIGFDVRDAQTRAMRGACSGLLGMQERVLFAGGQIEITSTPQRGTEIWVRFPLAIYASYTNLDKRSLA